jgi:hypothetical protein
VGGGFGGLGHGVRSSGFSGVAEGRPLTLAAGGSGADGDKHPDLTVRELRAKRRNGCLHVAHSPESLMPIWINLFA